MEFGWDVDPSLYNDNLPHLFVYHFLNGQPTCYNACGFVPIDNPKGIVPGETLAAGVSARYQILYSGASKEWLISYNGNEIGYFPESIWGGKFTKSSDETAFGEVASMSSSEPCSQMGDGVFGSNTGSTTVSKFDLIDPRPIATGAEMLFSSTVSSLYNVGHGQQMAFVLVDLVRLVLVIVRLGHPRTDKHIANKNLMLGWSGYPKLEPLSSVV